MKNLLYTIGLDFGSLSCRGVIAGTDGSIAATAEFAYPHSILDHHLPDGTPLTGSWYLQHPADYVLALETVVRELIRQSAVTAANIVGIGIDFTASTVILVTAEFSPLCLSPVYASHPHAWCKPWKHHGAEAQAAKLTEICRNHSIDLSLYGGRLSPECLLAKVLQVFEEDRPVYDTADAFVEAGDYIVSLLVGKPMISAVTAAAKALWSPSGYPDRSLFASFHPDLADLPAQKLADHLGAVPVYPGTCAGVLCKAMANRLGLNPGIAVSSSQMDGYVPMPALGIRTPGQVMMVIGTSTAIMLLDREHHSVPGITACLPDTYYPGLWGYASGQASAGDCFQWFSDNCLPESCAQAARNLNLKNLDWLTQMASTLKPGETGLLALDWFNGNKSPLASSHLTGLILGLTL